MARAKKPDTRKMKEQLTKALAKQNYEAALEACEALHEADPKDDRTFLKLAELYQKLGRKGEALDTYRALVDFYADDGRLPRAIAITKIVVELDPGDEGVQKKLALLYAKRGLPPAAAEATASEDVRQITGAIPVRAPPKAEPEPAPTEPPPAPAAPEEEPARRQLAAEDLEEDALEELDLAVVEMAPGEVPRVPPTPLFSDLAPEELLAVMGKLKALRLQAGDRIVRQGDPGDSVFLVCEGQVQVRAARAGGEDVEVATLGEGAFFGEFGMFMDRKRHATVVAANDVQLLELRHEDLMAVAANHPRVNVVLATFYRERALDTALAVSRLFGHLPREARKPLAEMCVEEQRQSGEVVLEEGREGKGLYLVKRGRFRVQTQALNGEEVVLADLLSGDFFGEISLLSGAPVTASVVATEPGELLRFERDKVREICDVFPAVKLALQKIRERRIHETIDRLAGVV